MRVPFLDLKAHHDPLKEQILAAIEEVIDSSSFAGGPVVARFEREFAAFCGVPHAAGVANGTDALWFALRAVGVGSGDEVVTVPGTFFATAEAITGCGARPVFVDIDEDTYTMDPSLLAAAITPRTKAIIPVHLFGQMADMGAVMQIAGKHGLAVIEDACQAVGARFHDENAGSIGAAGCFSFYPGKNLGAMGDAGAVVTRREDVLNQVRVLRDHGQTRKYHHAVIGWNGRMDGIQAAVLSVKLRHLERVNEARRRNAALYHSLLAGEDWLIAPKEAAGRHHVFHLYVIRIKHRDAVLSELEQLGIQCGVHYPIPVHLQEAYSSLGYRRGDFPVAEKCAEEFLSLPMYPELTPEQIHRVVSELRACVGRRTPKVSLTAA